VSLRLANRRLVKSAVGLANRVAPPTTALVVTDLDERSRTREGGYGYGYGYGEVSGDTAVRERDGRGRSSPVKHVP